MAAAPMSAEAFSESAQCFALAALEAHHDRDYRRAALNAGTAMEHLLKACLARRSRALVVDLGNEGYFRHLWRLIDESDSKPLGLVRTVSLRNALKRVRVDLGVPSDAEVAKLEKLADLRDGTVHAALDEEFEEGLLAAFVQHADALLKDLGRERGAFWAGQLAVVDALKSEVRDKIAHAVRVKFAAARARFEERYGGDRAELLEAARDRAERAPFTTSQTPADCPVCKSLGLATGSYSAEWEPDDWDDGEVTHVSGSVWFTASAFQCTLCDLRLDSEAELKAAGLDWRWEVEDADPERVLADVYSDVYSAEYGDEGSALEDRFWARLAGQQRARRTGT